jgi:hypothetical protein
MRQRAALLGVWLVCIFGALVILLRMLTCVFTNPEKGWSIAIEIDQAGNRAANGSIAETISSRANRARAAGRRRGCVLCKVLDWLDPRHCEESAGK